MTTHGIDYDNLPIRALIQRGLGSLRANTDALQVLRRRGATSAIAFLEQHRRRLSNTARSHTAWYFKQKHQDLRQRRTCLDPTPTGPCADCGKHTTRRFNGYWQCWKCREQIKYAGSRKAWKGIQETKAAIDEAKKAKEEAA